MKHRVIYLFAYGIAGLALAFSVSIALLVTASPAWWSTARRDRESYASDGNIIYHIVRGRKFGRTAWGIEAVQTIATEEHFRNNIALLNLPTWVVVPNQLGSRLINNAYGWPCASIITYESFAPRSTTRLASRKWSLDLIGSLINIALCTILFAAVHTAMRYVKRCWRVRQGCCHTCGYDNPTSLTSWRCPECGTVCRTCVRR